ncbi:MAG: C40 family peptidase [Treponema sp.]|nr:C40 family peptidase [Treponema sp.]
MSNKNNRKEAAAHNGAERRVYARQNAAEPALRKPHVRKPLVCRCRNVKIAFVAIMMSAICINCIRAQTGEEGVVQNREEAAGEAGGQRGTLIEFAMKRQGIPYHSGGSTEKGFDCSGFVWFVYRNALNMDVPRSSRGVWSSNAKTVRLEDALPGDVLVFSANKGGSGSINHTAILVDKDSMIHAVSSGPKRGIVISPVTDRYFAPRLVGVKRFLLD